ncbi:hypothetical protein [Nocardia sp. NPDC057440]|uniref:hypothetical protein n=1 Tax=Nocardia sp. NPDC057440 TaxID=3346134 RepID=UPI003670048D
MGELCDEAPRWRLSPTEPASIASRERAHGIVTIHTNLHPGFECTRQAAAAAYIANIEKQARTA